MSKKNRKLVLFDCVADYFSFCRVFEFIKILTVKIRSSYHAYNLEGMKGDRASSMIVASLKKLQAMISSITGKVLLQQLQLKNRICFPLFSRISSNLYQFENKIALLIINALSSTTKK